MMELVLVLIIWFSLIVDVFFFFWKTSLYTRSGYPLWYKLIPFSGIIMFFKHRKKLIFNDEERLEIYNIMLRRHISDKQLCSLNYANQIGLCNILTYSVMEYLMNIDKKLDNYNRGILSYNDNINQFPELKRLKPYRKAEAEYWWDRSFNSPIREMKLRKIISKLDKRVQRRVKYMSRIRK